MRYVPTAMMHGGGVPFMITTKFASREKNKKHKLITKITKKAPSLTTISTTINSAHTKTKQPCQLTSSSIKQTYWRDEVDPNEKDGPKMTTTQCNRRRRWSCLQCVRDGQRTKDHENSARHATKNKINTNIACVMCRQR